RDRRSLVAEAALDESYAADGAGVYDFIDSGFLCCLEQVARAIDVGLIEFGWIWRPEAVVGCDVVHQAAALDSAFEGGAIVEIGTYNIDFEIGHGITAAGHCTDAL